MLIRNQKVHQTFFCNVCFYSNTLWPQVWRGDLGGTGTDVGTACVPEDDVVLFFGASDEIVNVPVTRMAVLKALDLRQAVVPGKQTGSLAARPQSGEDCLDPINNKHCSA